MIQCQNTCAEDACLYKGLPKGKKKDSLGVNSIVKTAERYKGETDFSIKNKSFYIRVLLNIPKDIKEKAQTLFMLMCQERGKRDENKGSVKKSV